MNDKRTMFHTMHSVYFNKPLISRKEQYLWMFKNSILESITQQGALQYSFLTYYN